MTRLIAATAIALTLALPATAQEAETEEDGGFNLMEEGARLFFRGMMQEMEPALDELEELSRQMEPALREFVQNMGPALSELMGQIDDLSNYEPPEILPNGDIIIRRKPEADPWTPAPDAEVDI